MMCPSALTTTPEPTPLDWNRSPWLPTSVIRWTTEGLTASATDARASWNAERSPDTAGRSAATAGPAAGSKTRPRPMPAATPPARKTATRNARSHAFMGLFVLPRRRLDRQRLLLSGAQQLDREFGLAERRQHVGPELPAVPDRPALELQEEVVLLEAGLLRKGSGLDLRHEHALVLLEGELVAQRLADRIDPDAQLAAARDRSLMRRRVGGLGFRGSAQAAEELALLFQEFLYVLVERLIEPGNRSQAGHALPELFPPLVEFVLADAFRLPSQVSVELVLLHQLGMLRPELLGAGFRQGPGALRSGLLVLLFHGQLDLAVRLDPEGHAAGGVEDEQLRRLGVESLFGGLEKGKNQEREHLGSSLLLRIDLDLGFRLAHFAVMQEGDLHRGRG